MKNKLFLTALVMFAFVLIGCSSSEKATDGVREYVEQLYPGWTIEGQIVKDYDSDGDGYVSADVRIKNPATGEEKMLALDCAKNFTFNNGCKARVGGISQSN